MITQRWNEIQSQDSQAAKGSFSSSFAVKNLDQIDRSFFSLSLISLFCQLAIKWPRDLDRDFWPDWSVVQFPGFIREYFSSCSLWSSLLVASVTKHYSPLLMMYLVCFLLRKRIGDKNLKSDCVKKRMEQILEVRLHFFERKKMIAGKDSILWNGDDDNDGEMIGFKLFSSHSFQFRFMFLPCSKFVSFWWFLQRVDQKNWKCIKGTEREYLVE